MAYNLYPGPSVKKGAFSHLLDIGEHEGWICCPTSAAMVAPPYEKEVEYMHAGASGYIVRRRGMATDAPLASGQQLTVVSVKCGEKKVINPDANTMIRSQIPLFAQAPGWESETAVLAAA